MSARGKGTAVADVAADLPKGGTAAALTGGRAENPGGEGALGDLFGALDADVAAYDGATIAPPQRGRGRPPGSVNRSTREMKRWLEQRGYRDPLEFLASIYSMDTRMLAAKLAGHGDVKRVTTDHAFAALDQQRKAAAEAIPYLHQRTPMQVEHSGEAGARPLIMIVEGGSTVRAGTADDGAMSAFDLADFRQISAEPMPAADGRSHGTRSHDDD